MRTGKRFGAIFSFIFVFGFLVGPRYFPEKPRTANVFGSSPLFAAEGTLEQIQSRGFFIWGADAEGGGPYVFPDPALPSGLVGFEVDIAERIAEGLKVRQKQSQNAWESLIPALQRGDFDAVMNGIEITPRKEDSVLFSRPYYVYTEQLVVRQEEPGFQTLKDLRGKKVGTLSGAMAHEILSQDEEIQIRTYSGQAEPFTDLELGRLDAVLLDFPVAIFYGKSNPKLKLVGPPLGKGFYGIALRKGDVKLKEKIDGILQTLIESGELRRIYEKWGLLNEFQNELFQSKQSAVTSPATGTVKSQDSAGFPPFETGVDLKKSRAAPMSSFFPALLRGAGMTLFISTLSMALAMALGLILAIMRVYSRPALRLLATAYVEIYRGTPLLIQLYILYYGLPNIGISLSPMTAALAGLGMNYAAYEAELYRAGINAVARGQMEAALSLGMTEWMALRRIILPQAFRIALPGITNDFIALFKDSSLVSVIAMVELTKTYNILAASTLRFFDLGIVVALLYFAMSYPLSLFARHLESKLSGGRM